MLEQLQVDSTKISALTWESVNDPGNIYDDSMLELNLGLRLYKPYDDPAGIVDIEEHPEAQAATYTKKNSEHFYIDESIVTLNSPEIDSNPTIVIKDCKLRIVGMSLLSANTVDYSLDIGMGRNNDSQKMQYPFSNIYPKSLAGLQAFPLYRDSNMADRDIYRFGADKGKVWDNNDSSIGTGQYYIYPWHKEGSIIGWGEAYVKEAADGEAGDTTEILAKLNSKIEASLRYAMPTKFFPASWSPSDYANSKDFELGLYNADSGQVLPMKFGTEALKLYQGNYDSLITSSNGDGYPIYMIGGSIPIDDKDAIEGATPFSYINSKQPVRIAYKSTPHALIYLGKRGTADVILPKVHSSEEVNFGDLSTKMFPWLVNSSTEGTYNFQQDTITSDEELSEKQPYWYIGEIYREETGFEYGGTSEDALSKNTFVPAGEILSLEEIPQLRAVEGDTYYQRWDCIKTYPYAKDYTNSIVDIASVMVESHINLAGRYDRRRGMLENVTTSPENTGMVNKAYTQNQSMFSNISDTAVRSATDFPNQITWTGTKVPAALIDEWTHITLANTLDMDGDKGEIEAIRRFNNNLFCFQDKGISEILFNSRTQISTQEGVPIEIANSGKVEGKRYFTEHNGCLNKWSIVETASGIYFIDDLNKCISVLGEGIRNLSLEKGFDDWTKAHVTGKKWAPEAFGNAVSMYDRQFGDVYIIGKDFSLCFNEGLGQFTSFFSYESTPMMTLLDGKLLAYRDGHIWKQNAGDYNVFFGEHKPYYLEYRITPEPYGDKTFTNIEYRSDMWSGETYDAKGTFDVLDVSTEYQTGSEKLDWRKAMPANMQKKLRIWRAFVPRDANDPRKLNRIRNPWMKMRLTKDTEGDTERMEFHNLLVSYIE